jgi:hypothetical protein
VRSQVNVSWGRDQRRTKSYIPRTSNFSAYGLPTSLDPLFVIAFCPTSPHHDPSRIHTPQNPPQPQPLSLSPNSFPQETPTPTPHSPLPPSEQTYPTRRPSKNIPTTPSPSPGKANPDNHSIAQIPQHILLADYAPRRTPHPRHLPRRLLQRLRQLRLHPELQLHHPRPRHLSHPRQTHRWEVWLVALELLLVCRCHCCLWCAVVGAPFYVPPLVLPLVRRRRCCWCWNTTWHSAPHLAFP